MQPYKNCGGDSGVVGYEISDDAIKVEFNSGSVYLYNYQSAGNKNIEHMKQLAIAGQELNSFIGRVVKKGYASKLK